MINKTTAVSGSGLAYFFLLADFMSKASSDLGINKVESRKLVEKTFLASAMLQGNEEYTSLIKKIASKGGTTEAALKVFQKEKFGNIVIKAVRSAYKRAKELSR